jgi:hypothetical protein
LFKDDEVFLLLVLLQDPSAADPRARAQLDLLCQLIGGGGGGRGRASEGSKIEFQLNFLNSNDDDNDDRYVDCL